MSELNTYYIPTRSGNSCLCYLKSEVDKVIAEKDKQIEELKHQRDGAFGLTNLGLTLDDLSQMARKQIAHQKYKRCLAMRNMCRYAQYSYSYLMENESCKIRPNNIDFSRYNKKYHFYIRWRKRWLELAEKFRDNGAK